MLSWALSFLIIGLIAGLLGLTGIAGPAIQIEWILFVAFMILISISLLVDRRSPPLSIRNRLPKSRHWKFCLPKRIGCPRRSRRLVDSFTDWKPRANSKMPLIPRQVTDVQPEFHVLSYGHILEQGVILEYEPNVALLGR